MKSLNDLLLRNYFITASNRTLCYRVLPHRNSELSIYPSPPQKKNNNKNKQTKNKRNKTKKNKQTKNSNNKNKPKNNNKKQQQKKKKTNKKQTKKKTKNKKKNKQTKNNNNKQTKPKQFFTLSYFRPVAISLTNDTWQSKHSRSGLKPW